MMRVSGQQHAVPIHVWIKSIVLACLLFWGGFAYFIIQEVYIEAPPQSNRQFEQTFTNVPLDAPLTDVYILGSSLTRCAFAKFGSFKGAIGERNTSLKYKIVTRRRVVLGDYNTKITGLRQTKPQYLFIESNILCLDMFESSKEIEFSFYRLLKRYWSRLALAPRYISSHIWRMFEVLSLPAPSKGRKVNDKYWSDYDRNAQKYLVRSIHDFPEWTAFFEQAREAGIQVCILELPRSKEAREIIPDRIFMEYRELISQFEDQYGLEYIEFPYDLEQRKYFKDAAHLNKKGAELYSTWLVDLLSGKLNDKDN